MAKAAAVAALWLVAMKTGSMRMLLKAIWLAEKAKVTSRFSHSPALGTIAPKRWRRAARRRDR